jgi:hypothetical protein
MKAPKLYTYILVQSLLISAGANASDNSLDFNYKASWIKPSEVETTHNRHHEYYHHPTTTGVIDTIHRLDDSEMDRKIWTGT